MEKQRHSDLEQRLEALSPLNRRYISLGNQIQDKDIPGSQRDFLRAERANVREKMSYKDERELKEFGDYILDLIRSSKPLGALLNFKA